MASRFEYPLKEAQIDAFERDGVIHLPAVIDDEWIERGREACNRAPVMPTVAGARAPDYFQKMRVWEKDPVFKHLSTHSPAPGIAAQLVRSDKMNLLYDQMFNIEPDSGDRTSWHHDLPFWPVRGTQVVSVWIAFDRIDKDNGALEFIRGSNRWDKRFQPYSASEDGSTVEPFESGRDDRHVPIPDFDVERDQHELISFDLEPGDALAFHALTVHASYPNTTRDRQRRAYSMRFTGEEVRYYDGPVWNVYIVNPTLKSGDLLDSEQYPVVFDARSA